MNSANVGPYGDAITQEILRRLKSVIAALARAGRAAHSGDQPADGKPLAQQIFYPDFYNGNWGLCPDPVDFHAYQVTNLYEDTNAYERTGPFRHASPSDRRNDGDVTAEMAQVNHYELALATHSHSGQQYDVWQAVFSPAGDDGYPQPFMTS